MAAWGADDLEGPLTELDVDTEFWSRRKRLLDEFNELSAQEVHCRFWPGRESGGQLKGDWEAEVVNPDLPDPLPQVLRAIESGELSSLDKFVVVPVCAGDTLSRDGRSEMVLRCYRTALENAPNPWIQSELGYVFLERAETGSLPACAAALDKAEVIGRVGQPVPFPDRSAMLDLALQAFGRAWSYTYTPVHFLEDDPDPAFDLFTLDGLRVTLQELKHRRGLVAVCDVFEGFVEFDPSGIGEYLGRLGMRRDFSETTKELLRQPPADVPELYEEKCARQFGPHWEALTERARLLVFESEYEFSRLTAPTLRDWGSLTGKYCRLLESILRQRLGRAIDAEGPPLTDALGSLLSEGPGRGFARLMFGQFAYLLRTIPENQFALSLFRPFVEKNAPGQVGFFVERLPALLSELSREYRQPSAHDDPDKLVSRKQLVKLRSTLLPNLDDEQPGLLAQLAAFGQRAPATEQG